MKSNAKVAKLAGVVRDDDHPLPKYLRLSTMPSPIAWSPSSPSKSMFKKRSSSSLPGMTSAASYLAAVSQADARARAHTSTTPTVTPALSLSSSATTSSEDTVLEELEADNADGLTLPPVPPTSEQVFTTVHSEFGHCANESFRYTSAHPAGVTIGLPEEQEPPYYVLLSTYLSYIILICLGHLRDFFGKRFLPGFYHHLMPHDVSVQSLFLMGSGPPVYSVAIAGFYPLLSCYLYFQTIKLLDAETFVSDPVFLFFIRVMLP